MKREPAITLEDLPNVGPAIAADYRLLGFQNPSSLRGQDPVALYERLGAMTGGLHDPCVLDTFMSVAHYLEHGERRTWWSFTEERKKSWRR